MNKFTKIDLKNRDCVELRNGTLLMYVDRFLISNDKSCSILAYTDDLQYYSSCKFNHNFDIVRVYRSQFPHLSTSINGTIKEKNIVFYRKELPHFWNGMTMQEAHRKMWNDLANGKIENKEEWIGLNNINNENHLYIIVLLVKQL